MLLRQHCKRSSCVTVLLLALAPCCWSSPRRLQQTLTGPAPDLAGYRRAGCDNFTSDQWQPLRPAFHITVPYGWMNDPHGMFQLNGTTHIFMQYNPKKIQWGAPFWGHVVSRDLAHWTWLPPALLPDTYYDFNGVWSGAATVPEESGVPVLTYTAAGTQIPELGNFFQQQALAVPEDMKSDPLLKRWKKPDTNPFITQVPPGGTNTQFRDPTEARHGVWLALTANSSSNTNPLPKDHYALAVGVQAHCLGGGAIYTAPSMAGPWSYAGNLYNQIDIEPQINGQCLATRTASNNTNSSWPSPAYGGPCDQFGLHCRMWEVVDFLELEPGLFMIKWDDQSSFRGLFSMEWYVLGNGPWDYSAIKPPGVPQSNNRYNSQSNSGSNNTVGSSVTTEKSPSVFGEQYSTYPNSTRTQNPSSAAAAASTTAAAAGSSGSNSSGSVLAQPYDREYNYIQAGDDASLRSLFRGELDGQRFAPQRTDYGSIYASMIWRDNIGRQIMMSWIMESAQTCENACSDQFPEVIMRMGFKGAQSLPKALSYSRLTKTLRAYPVNETALLRGNMVFNKSSTPVSSPDNITTLLYEGKVPAAAVGAATNTAASNRSSSSSSSSSSTNSSSRSSTNQPTARQFEAQLNFTLQPSTSGGSSSSSSSSSSRGGRRFEAASGADAFAVGLRILTGNGTYVDVILNGTLAQPTGQRQSTGGQHNNSYNITSLSVWVDKSHAGGSTNVSYTEGGPVPLPVSNTWQVPNDKLSLLVWIDHSVVEVYAMGGLARVTSRIYPEGDDVAWGLAVWGVPPQIGGGGWNVMVDGQIWNIENAWLPPDC